MQKSIAFTLLSLDGYFTDMKGDMSWAHVDSKDAEWRAFVEGNASGGGVLLFGRITYELMVRYWPTQYAIQNDPIVARQMNDLPKVVFSRTLEKVSWKNTRLVKGNIVAEVRKMKEGSGEGMAILGSGSIVSQLAQEGLIDEYQFVVFPIVLGKGRAVFDGLKGRLKLTRTRTFSNANVLLCYEALSSKLQ
jgi:dihydrofolate reductase